MCGLFGEDCRLFSPWKALLIVVNSPAIATVKESERFLGGSTESAMTLEI
jgi:hypothetical protein